MTNRADRWLLGAALAAGWASPALAQSLVVRAVEAGTGRAVEGAIVRMVDSANQTLAQGLTSMSGRVVFRVAATGRIRLRADRIGHSGIWTGWIVPGDSASVTIEMPHDRVVLPELTVRGSTACHPSPNAAEVATLWDEIQKALTASAITAGSEQVDLAVRRFRQQRDLAGTLVTDSTVSFYQTLSSPFVSPPPARLAKDGYIEATGRSFQFHAPDAATLLSPEFIARHCFSLATKPEESLIGLAFEPTRDVKHADVRGVLWVDRETRELRTLEFWYLNAPRAARAPGIGGRVDFERLAYGAWIVRDWYIRAPNRAAAVRRIGGRTVTYDTLVGYLDQGGAARPVGGGTIALGEAVAQIKDVARVRGDLIGKVATPAGLPIAGAAIAVGGTDSVYRADGAGRFMVEDLPAGPVSLRILAIGFRPLGVTMRLSAERRVIDTTFVLRPVAQLLDSIVVTASADRFQAGRLMDFERRRAMGFGRFLTKVQLHDPTWGGFENHLRRFGRVSVVPCGWRGYAAVSADRGREPATSACSMTACFMSFYIDGLPFWTPDMGIAPPDITQFYPMDLEAVEVYASRAETPIEYARRGSECGVILIWTRVG